MRRREIVDRRLANTHVARRWLGSPEEVVRWLGAVQAQDFAGAKWAIGLRLPDTRDPDVEAGFSAGRIVRTHVLRPTWHFVHADDIRWMLALTGPHVHQACAFGYRTFDLDARTRSRCHTIVGKALEGGRFLTRDELRQVLVDAGVVAAPGTRMAHIMMSAELDGLVCSGPRRGKQFTYALLEERVAPARALDRDEALAELARRYVTSHGPATHSDFAVWSGLSATDAKRAIGLVAGELEQTGVDSVTYWFDGGGASPPIASPTAHLLPNYDEYFIGFKDRSAIAMNGEHTRYDPGNAALLAHIVIVDGVIVGGWRRKLKKNSVVVELDLLRPLTRAESRAVGTAAARYGEFLGLDVEVV